MCRKSRGANIKLVFHGGAREVGRSCIEIQTQGNQFLLDAGVKFKEDGLEFPTRVFDTPQIDGVFISHSHLDHSGALPMFEHLHLNCPIYMTRLTKKITKIMLKDSYKIERIRHLHPAYEKTDLKEVERDIRLVKYRARYHLKNIHFSFYNAGHIPGSASVMVEAEGKRLLYTGDIRTYPTDLMVPADTDYGPVDIMIVESTYGDTPLPGREDVSNAFVSKVEEVVNRGGSVLIPVFAVGRAQEILMLLARKQWDVPIYFDGLCKKITTQTVQYADENVQNVELLNEMYAKVKFVAKPDRRKEVALGPSIIVSTSGMMQGGPAMLYLQHMWGNPKNAVLLTGYQCKRTAGRTLLEEHYAYIDGWKTIVKCEVQKFDFSGHCDQNHLRALIMKVRPKSIIFNHGDSDKIDALIKWTNDALPDVKTYGPKVDDELEF